MLRTDRSKKGYAFASNPERQADVGSSMAVLCKTLAKRPFL